MINDGTIPVLASPLQAAIFHRLPVVPVVNIPLEMILFIFTDFKFHRL